MWNVVTCATYLKLVRISCSFFFFFVQKAIKETPHNPLNWLHVSVSQKIVVVELPLVKSLFLSHFSFILEINAANLYSLNFDGLLWVDQRKSYKWIVHENNVLFGFPQYKFSSLCTDTEKDYRLIKPFPRSIWGTFAAEICSINLPIVFCCCACIHAEELLFSISESQIQDELS